MFGEFNSLVGFKEVNNLESSHLHTARSVYYCVPVNGSVGGLP